MAPPYETNGLPEVISVKGRYFRLTLFRVETIDEDERPDECYMIPDDRPMEVPQNSEERYMVCYVPLEAHPLPDGVEII